MSRKKLERHLFVVYHEAIVAYKFNFSRKWQLHRRNLAKHLGLGNKCCFSDIALTEVTLNYVVLKVEAEDSKQELAV